MYKEFVLQMKQKYPFGELGQVIDENTTTSVCKQLFHSSFQDYEQIQQMIHFLKAAKHKNLINLKQVLQSQTSIQLYYQYVPLKLEGWLLDVNEELLKQLEQQFLELSQHLNHQRIKFTFDPQCVGVSAEMTLKYFMNQFIIDVQNSQKNLRIIQIQIKKFFNNLKKSKKIIEQKEERSNDLEDELKKSGRAGSISTNGSYSTQEDLSSLTQALMKLKIESQQKKATKGTIINSKLQTSKRKCYELLERFQKIRLQ